MKKIYCDYSKPLHEYLRTLNQDVSRLDELEKYGYEIKYVGSHKLHAEEGWIEGISGSFHACDGGYLDNGFTKVMPNEFFEAFGGARYKGASHE